MNEKSSAGKAINPLSLWNFLTFLLYRPAAGCAAGENESVSGYGQSDFIGNDMTAELWFQLGREHIRQYRRLQAGCIRIYQIEQRVLTEDFGT